MKISIKDNTKPVSKSLKINFNKLKEDKIDLDIIKIEYAGLFAKVISKLAKKGKTYQGEVTLLKALKKADLEIKLHQSNLLLDKNKSVNITEIKKNKHLDKKNLTKTHLLGLLSEIINQAKPLVRLKKVRVAGITHQQPIPLTKKQAETDAIKRILLNAKARPEKSQSLRLAKEFEEIYLKVLTNKTLTEVRELHKLADANRANLPRT